MTDNPTTGEDGKIVITEEQGRAADVWVTETAAVSWHDDNGVHLRVYAVQSGKVTERCYDQDSGHWYSSKFSAPADHVSATQFLDQDGQVYIHLYATSAGKTEEFYYESGEWKKGVYTTK